MSAAQHPNTQLLEIENHPGASVVVLREDVRQIAVVNALEDARRLVACWNACQGLRTEHIEELAAIGRGVERLAIGCHKLTKERDDLAAALAAMACRNAQADIAKLKGGAA